MKREATNLYIMLGVLMGIITILAVILFMDVGNKTNQDLEFFNNYVIAVNDYHVADIWFALAIGSKESGETYTDGAYTYDKAIGYFDESKEAVTKSKALLIHAKSKLDLIKDDAPNEFYTEEINDRLEQINILIDLDSQYFLLNDYLSKELEEINYGSDTEATRYYLLYNDLIPEVNINLQKLSDVSQRIDLRWDQDWYALFEGDLRPK